MKKRNLIWSIGEDLKKKYGLIEFAEYQREPTVWDLTAKRKLVDSILRNYDFANIYLYRKPDQGTYDCIDGRQRLSAILSFLGLNQAETDTDETRIDNGFAFRSSDELFGKKILTDFDGKTFASFSLKQKERFLEYKFNVVEITDIEEEEDLHLMFLRLQLGTALNGGEKLKAMKGYVRDEVYSKLGRHNYFDYLTIPARRFSRELTAAQIALNFYSLHETEQFARSRFVDLQDFFRLHSIPQPSDEQIMKKLVASFDRVTAKLSKFDLKVKNRAMGLSMFFSLDKVLVNEGDSVGTKFIHFLKRLMYRLGVEIKKGVDIPAEFRYLLKFQAFVSQAPVERVAIAGRDKLINEYFAYYLKHGKLRGESN